MPTTSLRQFLCFYQKQQAWLVLLYIPLKAFLLFCLCLLLSATTLVAQTSFAETLGYEPHEVQAPDTIQLLGNSEVFFQTPHHLPVSESGWTGQGVPINRGDTNEWKIFIVMLGMITIAIARYLFGSRLRHFFRAAYRASFFNQMEREGGFFNETITYLLYINFIVVISLLIWQTVLFFDFDFTPGNGLISPLWLFVLSLAAVSVFSLFKSMLLNFIAWVFNTRRVTSAYMKNMFLFNQIIGLALTPMVVYLTYNPSYRGMLFTWALLITANLVKLARGTMIGYSQSSFSAYYLILYLCCVELVPFALIIKLGSMYLPTT